MSDKNANFEVFIFLNRLRESGVTNMFGATPYIQKAFGIDSRTASDYLTRWMEWVNDDPTNLDLGA